MIHTQDISAKSQALRVQFEAKLGVKSRSLPHALKRAGRRLPRRLRKQGATLAQAERFSGNPKLARRVKPAEIEGAYKALSTHLRGIDAADARKGWWLALAGTIAAHILIIAAAFVTWLWWIGYV